MNIGVLSVCIFAVFCSGDKYNFAGADCGALVAGSNPETTMAANVLSKQPDLYMLNPCPSTKWIQIKLCQELEIDQVMLANQEMFSAGFNEFIITVGNVSKSFHAENSKKPQYFDFAARGDSLRLDFVSHYGEEFYCPITFIKVFGTPLHTNVPALIDPVVTDVLKARVEVLESHVRILGLIVVIILTILLFK